MNSKRSLREEIRAFQKQKVRWVPFLIVFGALGLVLPILPGLALLGLALVLLWPREGEQLLRRLRRFLGLQNNS